MRWDAITKRARLTSIFQKIAYCLKQHPGDQFKLQSRFKLIHTPYLMTHRVECRK